MKEKTIVQNNPDSKGMTAAKIERMLEERIRDGAYPEAFQLPTVRDLARQLRVNKNTVARAYQALEQKGYLELIRGRGAFVRKSQRWLVDDLARGPGWVLLDQLLSEAKQQGVSREAALHQVRGSIDRIFGRHSLQFAFVECNARDVEILGNELNAAVGYELEKVLLADILAHPEEMAARFDLIVPTFFHLSEVSQAFDPVAREKVIGVNAVPAQEALLNIARLQATVIGLVCDWPNTIHSLTHIVHIYHPSVTILPFLINDQPDIQALLDKVDAIVVTRSCYRRLIELEPQVPIVTVVFTIDQQSIDFLRHRIQQEEERYIHS